MSWENDDQLDLALLELVAGGDARALERLYTQYHSRLQPFLWRLGAQHSQDEAINDTFWVVWQKAKEFRGGSRVSTWIMGIAWRCAMKARRRNANSFDEDIAGHQQLEAGAEPLLAQEQREWLESGLATLPHEQRATLELAYFMGHSCEEIAAIMDCPVNTVKTRMFQARVKLRNLLPRLGGLEEPAC
ncbi:MAG TPA: sigma-70 family RNA polymerase sigma factor [Steroidobacteraceae bacterium]|jgi:RNA polymerase sigma-70 factor (ECF subfamily)